MDSQDKNDSRIRQREEVLARRVGEALDQAHPHDAGSCPDAGIIAAYAEQALDPAESAEWEGHFASCQRCRKILRVLEASADSPLSEKEVAQLGELVSAARAPIEIAGVRAGRARPRLLEWRARWLVPALGVAAVLVVWFAMRPPWHVTDRSDSTTLVVQAPKDEMPQSPAPSEVDQLARNAPQQEHKMAPAPSPDHSTAKTAALDSPAQVPANGGVNTVAGLDKVSPPGASAAASSLQDEKKAKGLREEREVRPLGAPPVPSAVPQAQSAPAFPAVPQSEARAASKSAAAGAVKVETNSDALENAPSPQKQAAAAVGGPAPQASASALGAGQRKEQAFDALRLLLKDSSLLKAPSNSILWRAGKGGSIDRSVDAGKTWTAQASPSQEDWLSGAAVSDTLCWVVGRHGAIARTMDGEHWQRVSPPAHAAVNGSLPDWTVILASDAQTATITAADGRRFATADAGKTWQPQ